MRDTHFLAASQAPYVMFEIFSSQKATCLMTDVQRMFGDPAPERQWIWRAALAITTLVAIAGVAVSMNQFFINYLHDQNPHTRTLGGILVMLLGIAGIGLPIVLIRKRQSFVSLGLWRGWL